MNEPKLYLKIGKQDEVDVTKAIPSLEFLGADESTVMLNTYQTSVAQDGQTVQAINYDKYVINANFLFNFSDWYDFKLIKHEIYRLFQQRQIMRIRTDAEPMLVQFVTPTTFEIKPISDGANEAKFTIPFDNPSGYKYSMLRSDELVKNNENNWQFGMNLPAKNLQYTFTKARFKLFNASDIKIDPYYQRHDLILKINFNGSNLKITNNTTQTNWSYNKPAKKTDQIFLNGIITTLNGKPASVNTDYGNLILAPGWNEISVSGAIDFEITFSFPFIYIG